MWEPFLREPISLIDREGKPKSDFQIHLDPEALKRLYRLLCLSRAVDERIQLLGRQGRIGPFPPANGRVGYQVASVLAVGPEDWVFPAHHDLGVVVARGMELTKLFAHIFARSTEPGKGRQLPGYFGDRRLRIVPPSSGIAGHLPSAVGVGMAARIRHSPEVVIAYFWGEASSQGGFYSALNFAGVFRAPVIFFCEGWRYGPSARETAAQGIAIKAVAAGVEGYLVDGTDPLGVYELTRFSVEKARAGHGPTLIEALLPQGEAGERSDPIDRLIGYLEGCGLWDGLQEEALRLRIQAEVDEAVRTAEAAPPPEPESLFTDLYSQPP